MSSDAVDFLMAKPNGANYVVLYQMLCLKTINTDGRLSRKIGEVIIPYDVDKIQRDCKWFSTDTVRVALELYTRLGLVYRDDDGTLVMTDHDNLVGSETDWGDQKRRQREQKLLGSVDNVHTNVPELSSEMSTQILEIRDKRLEIRDKRLEKESRDEERDKVSPQSKKCFTKPTLEDVIAYCNERQNSIDPQYFIDYNEARGWRIGSNPMKDWKAAIRTWERNNYHAEKKSAQKKPSVTMADYFKQTDNDYVEVTPYDT